MALLVKVALKLTNILAPFCNRESKVQLFFTIIDIPSPENISALVWFQSGKILGQVRKGRFCKKIEIHRLTGQ